uniref:Glycosyltransferase family 39 protein n=1 Tax=Desertifilum tharense IPPAS B-1220 TaxID=1781255 RepID=A0ACD5H0Z1_9CYAN
MASPLGWRLLLIALLVLGVYFRFVNIDRKVYWRDEAYTSMRISGYTIADVTQEIFTGQIVSQQQVQNFQRLSPDRGLDDTMRALSGNPEHPPLYYLSARFWAQVFGTSVQAMRSWLCNS